MFTVIKIMILIVMLWATYQDIRYKEISAAGIVLCAVLSGFSVGLRVYQGENILAAAIALLPGLIFVVISIATRGNVGIGDGLILMGIGPAFGLEHTVLGVFASLSLTCLVSIFVLVLKKGTGKSQLPFVPFVTLGMGVMMFA